MPDARLVLSVPAGKIYDLIFEHLIYSCPDTPAYQYDDTELMAFRTAVGRMAQILKIKEIYTLRPEDLAAEFSIPEDHRIRIAAYITAARKSGVLEKPGAYSTSSTTNPSPPSGTARPQRHKSKAPRTSL